MGLNLAGRHAAGAERDHLVVEAGQTALAFGHDLGLERPVTVARDTEIEWPGVGGEALGRVPVSAVSGAAAFGRVLLVAEVGAHLGLERALDQASGELFDEAAGGEDLCRIVALGEKLVEEFEVDGHHRGGV